jgi:hypothetical protein
MNSKVEAILTVIKKLLKWILLILLAIVILFGAFFYYLDYKDKEERVKRKKLEDKVSISVYYSGKTCSPGYPYFYGIVNNGDLVVNQVTFTVELRRKGFSRILNSYTSLTEDKILKPGEGYGRCFRASRDGVGGDLTETDVDISVVYKNVIFESKN